jgi:HNH endonuclease
MIYSDFLDPDDLKTHANSMNGRARQNNKHGTITADDLQSRIYESGGKCEWCNRSILKKPFHIDHIIPLASGGANNARNIAVACPNCNLAKSAKSPARFAQEIYAKTGNMTKLIRHVFDYYNIEALTQKSMFDEEIDDSDENVDKLTINHDEDSRDEPPPYIWGKK